ncbi:MAG: tRNA uridine-5-carboxymethylaminomethyl(34) synthesis GTPase MnmE [Methylovulum sp.]|nr:tRNA uridine-5-carboxymethylaminomethyl(34) synthesis GTPase MnmE [Methylovulum sp.]
MISSDTIAAIATPSGNGGVGIIRISGSLVNDIARQLLAKPLQSRVATFADFLTIDGAIIDSGIVLYFPAPHSYTGEHVLELQGHGGVVVLDMLLTRVLDLGARLARPGEFTERAFLNNKIDLLQAEAIADLIQSRSMQSVRSAQHSLQGVFSEQINALVEELTELRVYVEAAIDFVDEEIDFLTEGTVEKKMNSLLGRLQQIHKNAFQGKLLRDGINVVLAGKPNVGKSSLLNTLAGSDAAIISEFAGTTRDVLREQVIIDGLSLNIIDTAGLRDSSNVIEQEGIRRAYGEMQKADLIIMLHDICESENEHLRVEFSQDIPVMNVFNKIDLVGLMPKIVENGHGSFCYLSIKSGAGVDLFIHLLKKLVGFNSEENLFIARRRHVEALKASMLCIDRALAQMNSSIAGELIAEDLRQAQRFLSEITGEVTSDDLLGDIFANFCIGK